jgi:hypothetical protein
MGADLCSTKSIGSIHSKKENEIDELNEELLDCNISYMIIGLNANFNEYFTSNTYHISLFLYSRYNSKKGIIFEYAKFEKKENQPDIKYPYEEKGGLRYYSSTRPAFINNLCNIGNINIKLEKNYYFREILNKCCQDKKWTKNKYWLLFNNCQSFACDTLKKLKVYFKISDLNLHVPIEAMNKNVYEYLPYDMKQFCIK